MTWADIGFRVVPVLLGVLVARVALTTARTPQGASAWVILLISFPMIAIPAFALFGSISRVNTRNDARHAPRPSETRGNGRLSDLYAITHAGLHHGNDLRLLIDGADTFQAIFTAIDAAETDIVVQYYTIRDDDVGRALRDRLIAAADRGVAVRVLCDLVGSLTLGWRYVRELKAAGIEVRGIPGPRRFTGRLGLNFRNHRKTVVVDGRIGFTGGINVGQEYMDGADSFARWRDTHLRIEGPMVAQLRHLFAADWEAITDTELAPLPDPPATGDTCGLITGFGPTDSLERGSLLFCGLVGLARKRLWIATPYLVPHTDLITALQLAALRGVEVRILIPHTSDSRLAWYASRAYALSQIGLKLGIEVHEYQAGFMHQKVILIDDDIASIGTANLDIRSSLLNFEQTALIEDTAFAARVEAMLTEDFAQSVKMEGPGPWHVRLLAPVARLFGPIL